MTPKKLVKEIRSRNWNDIRWHEAIRLLRHPTIDHFRALVSADDRECFIELAQWEDGPERDEPRRLAIRLLRYTGRDPELRRLFQRLWKTEETEVRVWYLCWALLDFGDLEPEWHKRIWQEIDSNFDLFLTGVGFWLDHEVQNAHDVVRERLHDDRYPHSKRWIYLAAALAHPDQGATRSLLHEDRLPPDDDFTSNVRDQLIQRLEQGP